MARNTAPEDEPTSNWDYSHALQEGDKLHDTQHSAGPFEVVQVNDNGSVVLENEGNDAYGETIVFTEREINGALAHGNFERDDGKSHELATF